MVRFNTKNRSYSKLESHRESLDQDAIKHFNWIGVSLVYLSFDILLRMNKSPTGRIVINDIPASVFLRIVDIAMLPANGILSLVTCYVS